MAGALVEYLGYAFLLLAIGGIAYAVAAGILTRRFVKRSEPETADFPAVTLLKPLHGNEPDLVANLATFCEQDYPGKVQIVFGVQDGLDPALAVVRKLRMAFPGRNVVVAIESGIGGTNRKMANTVSMMRCAEHDVLILADSDIAVPSDYLKRIISALAEPGAGLVTCLYRGRAATGLWSRLSAMAISGRFLPNAVFGITFGLAAPSFGSTLALKRGVLGEVGGFEAFANYLADDYEIGRAVRARGYRVVIPPMIVSHSCAERSLSDLLRHELRWARTILALDRVGFLGSGATHAFPLALIGAGLLGFPPSAVAILCASWIASGWLLLQADRALANGWSWLLLPVRDCLSFVVYLAAFFGRSVTWRGRRFDVDAKGIAVPAGEH